MAKYSYDRADSMACSNISLPRNPRNLAILVVVMVEMVNSGNRSVPKYRSMSKIVRMPLDE